MTNTASVDLRRKRYNRASLDRSSRFTIGKQVKIELMNALATIKGKFDVKLNAFDAFFMLVHQQTKGGSVPVRMTDLFPVLKDAYPEGVASFEKNKPAVKLEHLRRITLNREPCALFEQCCAVFVRELREIHPNRCWTACYGFQVGAEGLKRYELPDFIFSALTQYIKNGGFSQEEIDAFLEMKATNKKCMLSPHYFKK